MNKILAYLVITLFAISMIQQCSPLSSSARTSMQRREEILRGMQ